MNIDDIITKISEMIDNSTITDQKSEKYKEISFISNLLAEKEEKLFQEHYCNILMDQLESTNDNKQKTTQETIKYMSLYSGDFNK